MDALTEKIIHTSSGEKSISVHAMNLLQISEPIDVMAVSAFYHSYSPNRGTLMEALLRANINVWELSHDPEIDLRKNVNVWLSKEVKEPLLPIKRIGCIEMSPVSADGEAWKNIEGKILSSIRAYFHMLEIASLSQIPVETIGLPVLGAGMQNISLDLILVPILNECVRFLESNEQVKKIHIITKNQGHAYQFAKTLDQSYTFVSHAAQMEENRKKMDHRPCAFISYSSVDRNIADNLCNKLESSGIKVWYAPRDIHTSDYATAIVDGINQSTHFIVIVSKNSLQSQHVLNEINVAFDLVNRGLQFKPLKIDEEELGAAFVYYLSRQHWMDAHIPPLEQRLDEFVARLKSEINEGM